METIKERLEGYSNIFEARDFVRGATIRDYWRGEFKDGAKLEGDALKNWAENIKEYLDDFKSEKYYLRDEVEELLNEIVKSNSGYNNELAKMLASYESENENEKAILKELADDIEEDAFSSHKVLRDAIMKNELTGKARVLVSLAFMETTEDEEGAFAYLYPSGMNEEDREKAEELGLELKGYYNGDFVFHGSMAQLWEFADFMGYCLHPDYIYSWYDLEDEITPLCLKRFNVSIVRNIEIVCEVVASNEDEARDIANEYVNLEEYSNETIGASSESDLVEISEVLDYGDSNDASVNDCGEDMDEDESDDFRDSIESFRGNY